MKILNAYKHKYIPQQMLIEKIKYGNGFTKEGAFYLPMFKGDSLSVRPSEDCINGSGIKEVLSTAAGTFGTIANVVSEGAKIVKSLTGSGIEADALNNIFSVKTGSGFYFVNSKK